MLYVYVFLCLNLKNQVRILLFHLLLLAILPNKKGFLMVGNFAKENDRNALTA